MFCHFPSDFLAAKLSKAYPTATCTNEQKILQTAQTPTQNTTEDDKQIVINETPQRESCVEDCKPQTEERKLLEGHNETSEEMKKEEEKMENEPCTEAASSIAEKGKYEKL